MLITKVDEMLDMTYESFFYTRVACIFCRRVLFLVIT